MYSTITTDGAKLQLHNNTLWVLLCQWYHLLKLPSHWIFPSMDHDVKLHSSVIQVFQSSIALWITPVVAVECEQRLLTTGISTEGPVRLGGCSHLDHAEGCVARWDWTQKHHCRGGQVLGVSTVLEPFGGRDQTPHDSFGVKEVGRYAGTVEQVSTFSEGLDFAEFPGLVIIVAAVDENRVKTEWLVAGNTPEYARKGV